MKKLLSVILLCLVSHTLFAQLDRVENNDHKAPSPVTFKKGTAEMEKSSEAMLTKLKDYLNDKPDVTLMRIEGHVDGEGDNNQSLSEARAMAVCKWLIANGVDCKRLIAVGFADTKPVSYTSNVENTRITFKNAGLRGRAIGGMPVDGGGKIAGDPCAK